MIGTVEQLYARAKAGAWSDVLAELARAPQLNSRCARFVKDTSGWSFLHQAAYFGRQDAVRALIATGADLSHASKAGETAADIAAQRGFVELASLMNAAARSAEPLWRPALEEQWLPSSCAWTEASERRAHEGMRVAYAGGSVLIPAGSRYFVDAFERVLVGWHGSYDPPCGMDGESML